MNRRLAPNSCVDLTSCFPKQLSNKLIVSPATRKKPCTATYYTCSGRTVRSPTAVSIVCMSGAPARAARAAHQPAPSAAPHSPERGPTRSGIVTRARPSVGRDPPLIGPVWGTGRRGRAREGMCTSVSRGAWRTAVQRRALTVGSGPQRWQTGRAGDPPAKERCREREEDW